MEEILRTYFGCKKPFKKNGQTTLKGGMAQEKLIQLMHDLATIGVIDKATARQAEREIDDICNSKNY